MHELYLLNRRDNRRIAYWHQLVNTWETSGLNQKVFSEQNGLNPHDLQRWVSKARTHQVNSKSNISSDFLPIEVMPQPSPTKGNESPHQSIELHHHTGFYLKIGEDFDNALLQKVMQLLARLP